MSAGKDRSVQGANPQTNGKDLQRAVNWIVNDSIFADMKLHGNVSWTPAALVRLAIFWVWSAESSLVAAATEAIQRVIAIFGSPAVRSYQALTGALKAYTSQLLPRLGGRLHGLMEDCGDASWRVGLWLALAVDGSRAQTPRTRKNEQRFCKPRTQGKKKRRKGKKRGRHAHAKRRSAAARKSHYDPQAVGPQMWLTLVWHIGQRLPWCWKIGPSYSSERGHLMELLAEQEFPEFTLFCGDAGFVGYDFWRAIADRGHHFLVRVGSNVHLLKDLGYVRQRRGIVYCWPEAAMKKRQPPLVLRLLHFHDGRGEVYLVTNVLSEKESASGRNLPTALGSGSPVSLVEADVWACEASQPHAGLRGDRITLVADRVVDAPTAGVERTGGRGRASRPNQYRCCPANHPHHDVQRLQNPVAHRVTPQATPSGANRRLRATQQKEKPQLSPPQRRALGRETKHSSRDRKP